MDTQASSSSNYNSARCCLTIIAVDKFQWSSSVLGEGLDTRCPQSLFGICVVGYCGIAEHLSLSGTNKRISEVFPLGIVRKPCQLFLPKRPTLSSERQTFHFSAFGRNSVWIFAKRSFPLRLLYIQKKRESDSHPFQNVLVLEYDFSDYVQLIPATAADHCVDVDALVPWHLRFRMHLMHVSGQGSHLKDKVIKGLNVILQLTITWA